MLTDSPKQLQSKIRDADMETIPEVSAQESGLIIIGNIKVRAQPMAHSHAF